MKSLYNQLKAYLPYKHIHNELRPILTLQSKDEILYVYSFDSKKKVAYISDTHFENKRYISLFELNFREFKILEFDKYYYSSFNLDSETLPF